MSIGISAPISPSPAGPSVGEMARQAATLVGLPDHPEALEEAKQGINRGIRELNTRVWSFTRKTNKFTLFANIKTYPLPQDWKRSYGGMYLDEFEKDVSRCKYIAPDELRYFTIDRTTAVGTKLPRVFTVMNPLAKLELEFSVPIPQGDIARTPFFKHYYFSNIPLAVNDTQLMFLPSAAENYLIAASEYFLARKHQPAKAELARSEQDRSFRNLLRDDEATHNEDWQIPGTEFSFGTSGVG